MSWPTWGIYLVGPCIQWYKKDQKKVRAWFRPLPRACTPWRRPASSRSDWHLYHLQSFVLSTEGWFLNIGTTAGTGFCWHGLVNNLTPSSFAADTKPEVFKFGQQLFIVMPFKGLFFNRQHRRRWNPMLALIWSLKRKTFRLQFQTNFKLWPSTRHQSESIKEASKDLGIVGIKFFSRVLNYLTFPPSPHSRLINCRPKQCWEAKQLCLVENWVNLLVIHL